MAGLSRRVGFCIDRKKLATCLNGKLCVKPRTIMTTTTAAEKEMEKLKGNPYFEKYSSKIAMLQQTSPDEFLARLDKTVKQSKSKCLDERKVSSSASSNSKAELSQSFYQSKPKSLNEVMKVELVENKSTEEIELIWQEYYKHKDGIAASIPDHTYSAFLERSAKFPLFLLPLPRSNGYEFFVCQFSGNEVHFTPLINYQAYKENAPECLTIIHYTDLMESKNIVLMRGEYNKETLDAKEAQCLANQLQLYYGNPNEKRTKLLERFTYTPGEFKHIDLIAELEFLTL